MGEEKKGYFEEFVNKGKLIQAAFLFVMFILGIMTQATTGIMEYVRTPAEIRVLKERTGQIEVLLDDGTQEIESISERITRNERQIILIVEDVDMLDEKQRAALMLLERLDERTSR